MFKVSLLFICIYYIFLEIMYFFVYQVSLFYFTFFIFQFNQYDDDDDLIPLDFGKLNTAS